MSGSRALGLALFLAAALLVTLPLVLGVAPAEDTRGAVYTEVAPGRTLRFAVAPSVSTLRLGSLLVLGERPAAPRLDERFDYELAVSWLDREGRVVAERRFAERSRVSWLDSGAPEGPTRAAFLRGDGRWLTDARLTTLPVRELLPEGGTLAVTVVGPGEATLLRAFGSREQTLAERERTLLAPTRAEAERAVLQSGVPSFELLTRAERELLFGTEWRSDAAPLLGGDWPSRRVHFRPLALRAGDERARLVLEPSRALALSLRGPVTLRVSGPSALSQVQLEVVSQATAGLGQAPRERPGTPLGLMGETTARLVDISEEGPFTLTLRHPGDVAESIPLTVSLDAPSVTALFGRPVLVPAERLLPGYDPERATTLVGPELRRFPAERVGRTAPPLVVETEGFTADDLIALDVRPLLDGPADERTRELVAIGRDASGAERFRVTAPVRSTPSPFERVEGPRGAPEPAPGSTDAWVGEPVRLFLRGNPEVRQVELTSTDELAIIARAEGVPRGDDRLYAVDREVVRVRYGDDASTWRRLRTEPRAQANALFVVASVRIEPRETETPSAPRRYTMLAPSSRSAASGELWLVPLTQAAPPRDAAGTPETDERAPLPLARLTAPRPGTNALEAGEAPPGNLTTPASLRARVAEPPSTPAPEPALSEEPTSLYCRFSPSDAPQRFLFAAEALHGERAGLLSTPPASLGSAYSLTPARGGATLGRAVQRVTRLTTLRQPSAESLLFSGPAGATLWLKTFGTRSACQAPYEPVVAHALAPGASLTFAVAKTEPEQLVILGGLAPDAASLEVVIDGGRGVQAPGLYQSATTMRRTLTLLGSPSLGARFGEPDARLLPTLVTQALRLGAELPLGTHRVTVTNRGASVVFLRVGAETESPRASRRASEEPAASLVRTRATLSEEDEAP